MAIPAVGGWGSGGSVATGRGGAGVGAGVGTSVGSGVVAGSGSGVGAGVAWTPSTTSARAISRTRSGTTLVASAAARGKPCATVIDRASPPNDGRKDGAREAIRNTDMADLATAPRNTGPTLCRTDSTMCRFREHDAYQYTERARACSFGRPGFSRYEIVTKRNRAMPAQRSRR